MQLITNKISTGKPGRFEDFIKNFKASQVKTASVKIAEEQDEAESSGQLKVEPLHQTGESTTMPKNGPNAKKDDGEKAAAADTDPEKEGKDSGQPKAEGTEKFTNDPKAPTKEEKGGSANAKTKVAAATCEKCDNPCGECTCDGECECKSCMASRKAEVKTAGELPEALKKHQFKAKGDKTDEDCKEEEKEASNAPKFVKWANLDSKNKSFITTYWRQLFGDEYVNALVADK